MKKVEIISEQLQDLKKKLSGGTTLVWEPAATQADRYRSSFLGEVHLEISGRAGTTGYLLIRLLSSKNELIEECQLLFYPGIDYQVHIAVLEDRIELKETAVSPDQVKTSAGSKGHSPLLADLRIKTGQVWRDIFYATDRKKENNGSYGEKRNYQVQYGTCSVSIPAQKEKGKLPRPSIWRLDLGEKIDRHIILQRVTELSQDAYLSAVKKTIAGSSQEDAFLFIHGFNTTFADAARRTAQMAHDLDFEGAAIMYSWASKGSAISYLTDSESIELAINDIVEVIRGISEKTGVKRLHLIAHSMGTRGLTRALIELKNETTLKFNQVILAAPDIDADVFVKNIAPRILENTERVTLYASSNDRALKASRLIRNNYRRAGDSGEQIICTTGVDTVDASKVLLEFFDVFHHNYFAQTNTLIRDIFLLLALDLPPEKRNLTRMNVEKGTYWEL